MTDTRARATVRFGWIGIAIAILFGLFYVYDLFEAVSNVVAYPPQIKADNDETNKLRALVGQPPVPLTIPWVWLVIDVLLAPVVFTLAFIIGRRKRLLLRVLLFVIGLTLVAATTLSVEALA
ncbi:hypothetical protein BH10ACT4_BH10ACT4_14600 [soil metagenome]